MRSSGRLAPTFLEKPRTQKLGPTELPSPTILDEDLTRIGVKSRPVHILGSPESGGRHRKDVVIHRSSVPLPPKSLISITDDIMVTSPGLTFLHLAVLNYKEKRYRDVEDLAMIGFELCGTYLLDDSWDGMTNTDKPLTTRERIASVFDAMPGAAGIKRAREALELVRDGSNSPMESILCALLTWPRRLGGYALGPAALNYHVATSEGDRYVDLAFPDRKVGLEYKGRESHSIEQVGRDDRRQNKLVGSGWTIINVWYEDLVEEHLFDQLVADVARALGVRVRIRSDRFDIRRALLRMRLIPAFKKYGGGGS